MIGLGYALIQKQRIEGISQVQNTDATVGRVGRARHAKRRFKELDTGTNER